jgi:hypothetical protein
VEEDFGREFQEWKCRVDTFDGGGCYGDLVRIGSLCYCTSLVLGSVCVRV